MVKATHRVFALAAAASLGLSGCVTVQGSAEGPASAAPSAPVDLTKGYFVTDEVVAIAGAIPLEQGLEWRGQRQIGTPATDGYISEDDSSTSRECLELYSNRFLSFPTDVAVSRDEAILTPSVIDPRGTGFDDDVYMGGYTVRVLVEDSDVARQFVVRFEALAEWCATGYVVTSESLGWVMDEVLAIEPATSPEGVAEWVQTAAFVVDVGPGEFIQHSQEWWLVARYQNLIFHFSIPLDDPKQAITQAEAEAFAVLVLNAYTQP